MDNSGERQVEEQSAGRARDSAFVEGQGDCNPGYLLEFRICSNSGPLSFCGLVSPPQVLAGTSWSLLPCIRLQLTKNVVDKVGSSPSFLLSYCTGDECVCVLLRTKS